MNRRILGIALPAIVSNIAVPLLGLMDITIAGHLGAAAFIGAVSVGAMMFNFIYWNFTFLRMGTSGMTAQAYGRHDSEEQRIVLVRATSLALLLGLVIVVAQFPLRQLILWIIAPGEEVRHLAETYFDICVWGAPAILATNSITGWFIGMQDSVRPMATSIFVNVLNIAVSLLCVYVLRTGFSGIAIGTLAAQWGGLLLLLFFVSRTDSGRLRWADIIRGIRLLKGAGRFFRVNRDIFLRSLCLMSVTLFFTSAGARSGDLILAVNALIMQFFVIFSYFMDGFAFAGEALAGKYAGAKDAFGLKRCVKNLWMWGCTMAIVFAVLYGFFGTTAFSLLTDNAAVRECAYDYRWWTAVIPLVGVGAFVWDGVYIGLTATRHMLYALGIALVAFFATFFLCPAADANNRLWAAFIIYLAARSAAQTVMARPLLRRAAA